MDHHADSRLVALCHAHWARVSAARHVLYRDRVSRATSVTAARVGAVAASRAVAAARACEMPGRELCVGGGLEA